MKAIILSVILLGAGRSAFSQIKLSNKQILNAVNVENTTMPTTVSSIAPLSRTYRNTDSEKLTFFYSSIFQFGGSDDFFKIAENARNIERTLSGIFYIDYDRLPISNLVKDLTKIQVETPRIKEVGGTQSAIRFFKTSSPRINSTGEMVGKMRWFSEKKFELQ